MTDNLTYEERQEMIDDYVNLSNQTANIYNESYRNLSNALLTAASIYMAVIAAVVASRELVASFPFWCVLLLGLSILAFLVSIIIGIALHMNNVSSSAKMCMAYRNVAKELVNSDAKKERDTAANLYKRYTESHRDKNIVIIQLIFFLVGAILLMFPLFVALANNWLSGQGQVTDENLIVFCSLYLV